MEKDFVPYEQALELKELGFDEACLKSYTKDSDFVTKVWQKVECSAPLYQQAFRWFREKYELFGEVIMYIPQEGNLDGCFTYVFSVSRVENYKKKSEVDKIFYSSVEKAELACLKKLIEITKNK